MKTLFEKLYNHDKCNFFLVAGPCVIESRDHALMMAEKIQKICEKIAIPWIYKSSFDKANRTSIHSFRGPGIKTGLNVLQEIKQDLGASILTDIHEPSQAKIVSETADVIQIPAFLCRQTDILVAAAQTGKAVNVKKGQFLAPWDMENVVHKLEENDCKGILLTDRGTQFGYNNLVADLRSIPIMQKFGYPVIFDATHSVQLPGGNGINSGGMREMIPTLARAAVAAGCDGIFMEIHNNVDSAKSDASTQWPLDKLEMLLRTLKIIKESIES